MIRNQAIRSKNQTSEKCISDHKSMLFFFQHHEEKSTFHDYYMEMITANFGDDLDQLRKVNVNFSLLFVFFIIIIVIIIAIVNFEIQSRRISDLKLPIAFIFL